MDLKEAEKRRGWLWKKKNGFGEGGTSSPPVKLFDEQVSVWTISVFLSLTFLLAMPQRIAYIICLMSFEDLHQICHLRKLYQFLAYASAQFLQHLLALLSEICAIMVFRFQEVARILEDQIRSQQEQMDSTLREVDEKYMEKEKAIHEKYTEKEKAINEKLDAVNKKLTAALAEITVKDNIVKQHIKVVEEAVVGKFGCFSCHHLISRRLIFLHCNDEVGVSITSRF